MLYTMLALQYSKFSGPGLSPSKVFLMKVQKVEELEGEIKKVQGKNQEDGSWPD